VTYETCLKANVEGGFAPYPVEVEPIEFVKVEPVELEPIEVEGKSSPGWDNDDALFARLRDNPSRMDQLQRRSRRISRQLRLIRFLQTARKPLSFFGKSPLERLCAALILCVPFFFLTLWMCLLAHLPNVIAIAIFGVVVLFVASLIAKVALGKTDADLEEERQELERELPDLQERIVQLESRWVEDQRRAQEIRDEQEAEEEAREEAHRKRVEARRAAEEASRPKLAECPDCGAMVSVQAHACPKCGCPFADEKGHGPRQRISRDRELERAILRTQDLTSAAVLTFILYLLFWLPGLIVNLVYLDKASRIKRSAGQEPAGAGCLIALLVIFGIVPIVLLGLFLAGGMR
jgi:Skp family chaperone for outer membrane proteins